MVATELLGTGVDFSDVKRVVQYVALMRPYSTGWSYS